MTDDEFRTLIKKCKQHPNDKSFRLQLANEVIKLYDEVNDGGEE